MTTSIPPEDAVLPPPTLEEVSPGERRVRFTVDEGNKVKIGKIKFEGNKSISGGDLLGHIATAPSSGFFSKTARYYDADLFALDVRRIVRW